MVKFAKNGSDATTAAVRLARAVTGREVVAVCDQPFFSVDDWFIGTTAMDAGIPPSASTVRFAYNDLDSLAVVLETKSVACVVMEAATALAEPAPGYLPGVRALCDRHGALLVFDEMITGLRWSAGGAQQVYGVVPDLSCWGKAMGNGFPLSALAGTARIHGTGRPAHRPRPGLPALDHARPGNRIAGGVSRGGRRLPRGRSDRQDGPTPDGAWPTG